MQRDDGYCKMSISTSDGTPSEEKARADADGVIRYLASVLPAFEDSYVAGTSLKVLEREGRRIKGAYTLTKEDVLAARKFPDGVVRNAWPIELWDREKGTSLQIRAARGLLRDPVPVPYGRRDHESAHCRQVHIGNA